MRGLIKMTIFSETVEPLSVLECGCVTFMENCQVTHYSHIDYEILGDHLVAMGVRRDTKAYFDSLKIVWWVVNKLQQSGRFCSKEILYTDSQGVERNFTVESQLLTIQTQVIADNFNVSFSRIKYAKRILAKCGIIEFYRTLPRDKNFLKLWKFHFESIAVYQIGLRPDGARYSWDQAVECHADVCRHLYQDCIETCDEDCMSHLKPKCPPR